MRVRSFPGLFLIATIALFVVPSAVSFYADWLWFGELGYEGLFLRILNAQAAIFLATASAVFAVLYLNLRIARRTLNRPHVVLGTGVDGRAIAFEGRRIAGLALPAALIIALAIGLSASRQWMTWLAFFNGVPFGQADAIFGRDVSFYMFRLPALELLRSQALATVMLALVGCGLYYVLSGSFVIEPRYGMFWPRFRLVPLARRHLGILAAAVFALLAWGTWLEIPGTLLTAATPTVGFGASYVDVHARLPFLWVSLAVLAIGAGLALVYGFGHRGWPLPLAIGLYMIVSIAGGLYGAFVQRLIVLPNELDRERPYIVHNIEATRKAYALDRVEEREISGDAQLSAKDIIANAGTIENVRLWDHQPLLQTFAQIQEIRTYYDFHAVDNDRYAIDGKTRQVMLSVRELNSESIPNQSWINERLTFTHGYGLTLGPVNQVTTAGQPVLFVRDLPPVSTVPDLRIDQPSIYFGELSNNYVLVRTRQPEFHYPRGDDNETTYYEGSGGVPVGGLLRRLLFAIRFANTDILVTNQITPDSRILFYRRINERVSHLAPFLSYDADPYPVVSQGRIFWIQDAYTLSASYPYATPTQHGERPINYIRNSVKVVVDAYNGSVTFYLAEPGDPVALTLNNIFPGMLRPLADMPADLRRHLRYPEEIFKIQATVYQSYHMTNPQVFYNKEDQWQVPAFEVDRASVPMQPYYTVMRLPGERETEFIQMLPFTPRLKENLAAWMAARSDGEHYGRLFVFQFPKQKIVYGPKQIVGLINQDQVISQQITLWSQGGSSVIWGTLLVIPVNESLLYVRPLYLRSPEGRIPELKRVIVVYQNRIVMAETLTLALGQIFGKSVVAALESDRLESAATPVLTIDDPGPGGALEAGGGGGAADQVWLQLVAEMRQHFDRADQAMRAGNLAGYADEMKKAEAVLQKLERIKR
jgi:uncharacterized membrane protein (UPF0182 family)